MCWRKIITVHIHAVHDSEILAFINIHKHKHVRINEKLGGKEIASSMTLRLVQSVMIRWRYQSAPIDLGIHKYC